MLSYPSDSPHCSSHFNVCEPDAFVDIKGALRPSAGSSRCRCLQKYANAASLHPRIEMISRDGALFSRSNVGRFIPLFLSAGSRKSCGSTGSARLRLPICSGLPWKLAPCRGRGRRIGRKK